jgi:hypothetical protein
MYRVRFFNEGMVVAIPGGGLRFLEGENRPYIHSLNLRIDMDRVIYIADCGVEQTILPLASPVQQDEYAWAMKSICTIDQGMPWSNAMAYGVAHDLVPWVETDLRLLTHHSGVTLSDLELWVQYGDCCIQALDVADLFDNPTQMDSDSRVQATPTMAHNINDDLDDLKCNEAIEDKPLCIRKLNLM